MKTYRILVADDQPGNLDTIIRYLEESSGIYNILNATNGKIACKVAEKKQPDLIIMDWEMPVMSGIEAIRYLKAQDVTTDIPIIMATGVMLSPAHLKVALDAGAIDYIRKPIERTELLARVNSILKLADSYKMIKEQNENIQSTNKRLLELNYEKDQLIHVVAHDLKVPLSHMSSLVHIIDPNADNLTEKQAAFLQMIGQSSDRLIKLINKILDIEAIESKKAKLHMEPVDIRLLLRQVSEEFTHVAIRKNIEIISQIGEGIVWADKTHLTQILENLLSNAVKFSPKNSQVQVHCVAAEGNIRVEVQDQGKGVLPEEMSQLFIKYQKLSTRPTAGEKSTGLGLSIVKQYVEAMQGRVWCESTPKKGAKFIVEFAQHNPAMQSNT
ncbi:hybrid sensor histidine kinase/response regulator [uncultured Microscilla sp.]|uniref:hybrid sensor histidine kinase/response regulator n=1 Tax=uncultured Microscilla sp. TaxID=432653 RepID=UPI00260BAB32|nr:hybrid sensor histidine kinase/response regulator [uncultured Microscilla sp.]